VQSFGSTKGRHDENIVVVNEVLKTWKKNGVMVSVRLQATKYMNQHSALFCNKGKVINRHRCDLVSSVLNNNLIN